MSGLTGLNAMSMFARIGGIADGAVVVNHGQLRTALELFIPEHGSRANRKLHGEENRTSNTKEINGTLSLDGTRCSSKVIYDIADVSLNTDARLDVLLSLHMAPDSFSAQFDNTELNNPDHVLYAMMWNFLGTGRNPHDHTMLPYVAYVKDSICVNSGIDPHVAGRTLLTAALMSLRG